MYSFLAPHIELQMVYKGKLMSWSGTGLSLNQKSSLPMLEEMVASIRADIYAVVQLGVDRNEFEGLLDDI
mgnify:CR=1 FL=1